jgi:hypothetical protein
MSYQKDYAMLEYSAKLIGLGTEASCKLREVPLARVVVARSCSSGP